ncbi:MAG TPA: hypothetical protein PLU46_03540, partial [Thiotrichales bacterium]|nr:hypothetical protein [Thiotrichales bacterium]HQT04040.1 hypothetical protein [Thiotrichales bacterium]
LDFGRYGRHFMVRHGWEWVNDEILLVLLVIGIALFDGCFRAHSLVAVLAYATAARASGQ